MAKAITSVKKLIPLVRQSGAEVMITVLLNAFKDVFQHQYGEYRISSPHKADRDK